MTDHVVTVTVSDQVYEHIRRIAATSDQPIEEVLRRRLQDMLPAPAPPSDEEAELAALRLLSDDALRLIKSFGGEG